MKLSLFLTALILVSCATGRKPFTYPGLPPGVPPAGVVDPTPEDPFDVGDATITGIADSAGTLIKVVDPTPGDIPTEGVIGGAVLLAGAAWGLYKKLKPKDSVVIVTGGVETPSN